jgi:hypothetical protein
MGGTKRVISIISKVGQNVACRYLFRDRNTLPVPCLYISEVICCIKLNTEEKKLKEEIHNHCMCHKSHLHIAVLQNYS